MKIPNVGYHLARAEGDAVRWFYRMALPMIVRAAPEDVKVKRKRVARKRGAVILMSSLTAFQGSPFVSVYGATKAFNLALAEGLWAELQPHGVDVLACCAGATRTPNWRPSRGR